MSVLVKEGGDDFVVQYQDRKYGGVVRDIFKVNKNGIISADNFYPKDSKIFLDANGSYMAQARVTLTNSEVLNLRATPKVLVPAVGAGKTIDFVNAILIFDRTGAYAAGAGDDLGIRLNNTTGTLVSATIEATGFLTAAGDAVTFANRVGTAPIITAAGELSNPSLVLHNVGGAEFTAGNAANKVTVLVNYIVRVTAL